MRKLVPILCAMAFCVPATHAADAQPAAGPTAITLTSTVKWALRLPQDGVVPFQGVVSFDDAGGRAVPILYPAPNLVGFVAAVIAHGVVVESTKQGQKDRIQTRADRILLPYKAVIDGFNFRELMRRALGKLAIGGNAQLLEESASSSQEFVVESRPVFSLTQDQQAIILDNTITIRKADSAATDAYSNTNRIVSAVKENSDPAAFWTANDGEKLKEESAKLVAESLDIAFNDAAANTAQEKTGFRTIRYREGLSEKMERAQIVSDQCDRMLLRTLRGTLMSVPVTRAPSNSGAEQCAAGSKTN